jgi:hypothetical protein
MNRLVSSRVWIVLATLGMILAASAAVIGTAFWNWKFALKGVDHATRINTVVAVSAYVLVAATLVIALIAYLAATGRPSMSPEITFGMSRQNNLVFELDETRAAPWRYVKKGKQSEARVVIHNRSKYAARNPGMRVILDGLGGLVEQPGWTVIASENQIGPTAIQWDGGTNYMIHGSWSRTLPALDFSGVFGYRHDPPAELIVSLVADGFDPRSWHFPVKILEPSDYQGYIQDLGGASKRRASA